MLTWKLPPKAKIYEALSAIADDRVQVLADGQGRVTSSNGAKAYTIEWSENVEKIISNDNASFYQGYMGYPIISILMALGKIKYDRSVADLLAGIDWNSVNKKFKNKYEKAVDSVFADLSANGVDRSVVDAQVDDVMRQLESFSIGYLSKRILPPSGK